MVFQTFTVRLSDMTLLYFLVKLNNIPFYDSLFFFFFTLLGHPLLYWQLTKLRINNDFLVYPIGLLIDHTYQNLPRYRLPWISTSPRELQKVLYWSLRYQLIKFILWLSSRVHSCTPWKRQKTEVNIGRMWVNVD